MHMTFIGPGPASATAPGYLTTGVQSIAGLKTFTTTLRATGSSAAATGTGAELFYAGGQAFFAGVNRTAGLYVPATVAGSTVTILTGAGAATTALTATTAALTAGLDVVLGTAGLGFKIKEGSNATMGAATLVGGTATVSTTKVTASSRIFLTSQADGGTPGWLRVSARTADTSFVITSSDVSDTSTVAWVIIEPAS